MTSLKTNRLGITSTYFYRRGLYEKNYTYIIYYLHIFSHLDSYFLNYSVSIDQLPHFRSINLIPFYYPNKTTYQIREVLDNLIIFIPFGLYLKILNINSDRTIFLDFLLSISLELSQYIFCLGASDITDLITNTTGVLVGVGLYYLLKKIFKEKTNKIILALAAIVTILFVSFDHYYSYKQLMHINHKLFTIVHNKNEVSLIFLFCWMTIT